MLIPNYWYTAHSLTDSLSHRCYNQSNDAVGAHNCFFRLVIIAIGMRVHQRKDTVALRMSLSLSMIVYDSYMIHCVNSVFTKSKPINAAYGIGIAKVNLLSTFIS